MEAILSLAECTGCPRTSSGEEVEGVRQEVREVKEEENGEINGEGEPHTS